MPVFKLKLKNMLKKLFILIAIIFPLTIYGQVTAQFTTDKAADSYCLNDTISFTNTSSGSYVISHWDFGDGIETWTTNPLHVYQTTGSFTVTLTVTDASENTNSTSTTLTISQIPTVTITNNPITQTLTASSSSLVTYQWLYESDTTAETDSIVYYLESGLYTAIATNASGCSARKSINVSLGDSLSGDDSLEIIVKNNILTPDMLDGINDVLFIEGLAYYNSPCYVWVYNIWGQLVYYNPTYTNLGGFEGKDNRGRELDPGTYYYMIKSEGKKNTTGYIDLIR